MREALVFISESPRAERVRVGDLSPRRYAGLSEVGTAVSRPAASARSLIEPQSTQD